MRVIHEIRLNGMNPSVPRDAQILSVKMRDDGMYAWYTVDPSVSVLPVKRLLVLATGEEVTDGLTHIATVQDRLDVWHVFIRQEARDDG